MAARHEIAQMEAENAIANSSRESLIDPNKHEVLLNVSELDTKPFCRICYCGSSRERLLKPCKCKGSIQYVHRNCLERWLEAKNVVTCELCHHRFETKRTRKGCWEWLRQPEMQTERRNFIGDCTCFAFLTPLGIATFWLCAEGAIYYQKVKSSTLETIALVTLAIFLVVAYFTWIVLCTRYHFVMWTRWRDHNWNVHVVEGMPTEGTSIDFDSATDTPSDTTGEFLASQKHLPGCAAIPDTVPDTIPFVVQFSVATPEDSDLTNSSDSAST